ncbi:MAG: C4-dicarboxylate ABC transporter [Halomonadaceae bacterium]|nr:MAG: C4-dicarboxylate ABC transporter [Halomonadaceae bacterium]
MTRSTRWLSGLTMAFALGMTGCGDSPDTADMTDEELAAAREPTTWRFALEEVDGSVQDAYAQEFKRRIAEASDGDINVEVYPYGSLGTSSQITELLQNGAIELGFASAGHLGDIIPEVGAFTLHFLLSEDEEVNRQVLADERLHSLLSGPFSDEDLHLLSMVQEGWMVWSGNKELRSPEDFKDFRIRTMTSPILVESYKAYGANPTPTPYSEVYSGLQLGQIDGQVNPIFAIEEMSFYEEQDVLTSARHEQFIAAVVAGHGWYNRLPQEQRDMVDQVRDDMVEWIDKEQIRYNEERLQRILDAGGTEYVELTEAERDVFREASRDVRNIYLEDTGDVGQEILDLIAALIEEYEG